MAEPQSSSSSNPVSPPPDPKRHITTTSPDAKAVFSTIPQSLEPIALPGGALLRLGYQTPRAPASLADDADVAAYQGVQGALLLSGGGGGGGGEGQAPPASPVPPGAAAAIWYLDTPPGAGSPLHRTVSLDVAVLLEGEAELLLDGGETRHLRPGDMAVQRATMHAWRNPSATRWSRMVCVVSQCEPVVVGGETLGACSATPQ